MGGVLILLGEGGGIFSSSFTGFLFRDLQKRVDHSKLPTIDNTVKEGNIQG